MSCPTALPGGRTKKSFAMAKLQTFQNGANNSSVFLTSDAGEEAIRKYFAKILELSNSGEEFPIDLDDVWPLAYGRKEEAVRALCNSDLFLEGSDYKVLRRPAGNSNGGRPSVRYLLNLQSFEFFIARRVRNVFEVYREVFHRTINSVAAGTSLKEFTEAKSVFVELAMRVLNMNEVSKVQMLQDNFAYLGPVLPDYVKVDDATMSATDLLKRHNVNINAAEFNKKLSAAGYIERLERTSTSGKNGKKSFWKVTEKGMEFGENEVSSHNPKETQPRWFVDKFPELLKTLDLL